MHHSPYLSLSLSLSVCLVCVCVCVYVYVCVCVCVYVCVYVCVHVCVHVYVYVYIYVCMCIYMCVYVYVCVCVCVCVYGTMDWFPILSYCHTIAGMNSRWMCQSHIESPGCLAIGKMGILMALIILLICCKSDSARVVNFLP